MRDTEAWLELERTIKALHESVWAERADQQHVNSWLSGFREEREQLHALHLLSQFMYFGTREIRALLRVLYRQLVVYPEMRAVRKANDDTRDESFIDRELTERLEQVRFLGMGNSAESGTHLLYYFRQENRLSKKSFSETHRIISRDKETGKRRVREPDVKRYIFLDDLCGSGQQACDYWEDLVLELKDLAPHVQVDYLVLFGTHRGLAKVRRETGFDRIAALHELDSSFACFGSRSRYYHPEPLFGEIDKKFGRAMCLEYGSRICPGAPFGFGCGQLLIGFAHNVPDNTLPIIWSNGGPYEPWHPMFPRYHKW